MLGKNDLFITVFFRLHNGNGLPLTLEASSPFYKLIDMLHHTPLQLPSSYTIRHQGSHIQNYDLSLDQLHVHHHSILHVQESLEPQKRSINMDVCICLDDQFFILKAKPTSTIKQLKQTISKLIQIPPKHQILIFCGQVLKNSKVLNDYNIHPNSLLSLLSTHKKHNCSEVLSDYQNIANTIIKKDNHLLDSVLSMGQQRTASSKLALFRSDSIDKKNVEELPPIEIMIRQNTLDQNSSLDEGREFNFDPFRSLGLTPMVLSVDNLNDFKCKLRIPEAIERIDPLHGREQSSIEFDENPYESNLLV